MPFILGPEAPAIEFLRRAPRRFSIADGAVVVAWARRYGVALLAEALGAGLGSVDIIVGMAGRSTSAEALALLRRLSSRLFVFHKHHRQTFHPKVYLLTDGGRTPKNAALLVGSSNLTGGGLYQNFEGNLALDLEPASKAFDRELFRSVVREVSRLIKSPFCEQITSDRRIYELLEDRYISTERALERKRAAEGSVAARRGKLRSKPEAPPPQLPPVKLPALDVVFRQADELPAPASHEEEAITPAASPIEQFYVRTLTQNDVNKLHGRTPGTPEWDIGETARNVMPAFWGWPDHYQLKVRQKQRLEWPTKGLLRSSTTSGAGIEVDVVLWYREAREGHAAEHRLRIGPRPSLIQGTPDEFDTSSLVVLERLEEGGVVTFLVQLLTRTDAEYADYARYLIHQRPEHKYGYGP